MRPTRVWKYYKSYLESVVGVLSRKCKEREPPFTEFLCKHIHNVLAATKTLEEGFCKKKESEECKAFCDSYCDHFYDPLPRPTPSWQPPAGVYIRCDADLYPAYNATWMEPFRCTNDSSHNPLQPIPEDVEWYLRDFVLGKDCRNV